MGTLSLISVFPLAKSVFPLVFSTSMSYSTHLKPNPSPPPEMPALHVSADVSPSSWFALSHMSGQVSCRVLFHLPGQCLLQAFTPYQAVCPCPRSWCKLQSCLAWIPARAILNRSWFSPVLFSLYCDTKVAHLKGSLIHCPLSWKLQWLPTALKIISAFLSMVASLCAMCFFQAFHFISYHSMCFILWPTGLFSGLECGTASVVSGLLNRAEHTSMIAFHLAM